MILSNEKAARSIQNDGSIFDQSLIETPSCFAYGYNLACLFWSNAAYPSVLVGAHGQADA
ncbi:MAG: hypothetical protein G01um101420_675 [Parcubacteria group bacterium Gr01-1014_20]|nr:MAG: hypothetical protein G01um101420_675 [Parcubacteria group bacterium Gr01-1014_20]